MCCAGNQVGECCRCEWSKNVFALGRDFDAASMRLSDVGGRGAVGGVVHQCPAVVSSSCFIPLPLLPPRSFAPPPSYLPFQERFLVLKDLVLHTALYVVTGTPCVRPSMHLLIRAIIRVMVVCLCCRMLLESCMRGSLDPSQIR
jgi:hypothetical protein